MQPQFSKSTGRKSRSMKTCGRSRRKASGALTSSAAASPAKTSASPEKVLGSPVLGPVFGTSSLGSFAQFSPDGWLLKTSQPLLLEGSEPYSETWPKSGLMRNGIAYRLQPLVRRTDGNAFGLWPTPNASDVRPRATAYSTARRVRIGKQISLEAAVKFLPTPTAQDASNNGGPSQYDRNSLPLNAVAGGSLNPTWVEWLMGFPAEWTALDASETPSSRKSLKSSGGRSSRTKKETGPPAAGRREAEGRGGAP